MPPKLTATRSTSNSDVTAPFRPSAMNWRNAAADISSGATPPPTRLICCPLGYPGAPAKSIQCRCLAPGITEYCCIAYNVPQRLGVLDMGIVTDTGHDRGAGVETAHIGGRHHCVLFANRQGDRRVCRGEDRPDVRRIVRTGDARIGGEAEFAVFVGNARRCGGRCGIDDAELARDLEVTFNRVRAAVEPAHRRGGELAAAGEVLVAPVHLGAER